MGKRYFWSRYSAEEYYSSTFSSVPKGNYAAITGSGTNKSEFSLVCLTKEPSVVGSNKWSYSGSYYVGVNIYTTNPQDYPYCFVIRTTGLKSGQISSLFGTSSIPSGSKSGTLNIDFNTLYGGNDNIIWGDVKGIYWSIMAAADGWRLTNNGTQVILICTSDNLNISEEYWLNFDYYKTTYNIRQGDFIDRVTSNKSNFYPTDGYQSGYWYIQTYGSDYNEYDYIDPLSVTIPSAIKGNETINIVIEPRDKQTVDDMNSWLGTVTQYTYEYNFGDNQWKTLVQNTTSTEYSILVPLGTKSLTARVKASDTIGFVSTDYVYSETVLIKNNEPPSAPGKITVSNIYADQIATIAITQATDTDGEIVNYSFERSIDGSSFEQIKETESSVLSITDNIGTYWGTVTYRARAKDNYGEWGPYVTSQVYTINENFLTIATPSYSLGNQISPFHYIFSIGITGKPVTTDNINVEVYLDNNQIFNQSNIEKDQQISIPIDPRLLSSKTHTILIYANKEGYVMANQSSNFYIEGISAPGGGIIEQLQNSKGQAILPYTLAQCVIGKDGKDINTLLEEQEENQIKIYSSNYTGTGAFGESSPNTIALTFEPKIAFLLKEGQSTGLIWGGSPILGNIHFSSSSNSLAWYANSAEEQYNISGAKYYYTIIG